MNETQTLSLQFGGMNTALAAVLAVACCVMLAVYARFLARVEFPRWWRTLALRAAALACVLLLISGVRVRYPGSENAPRRIAILLDTSQSMMIADGQRGASRFDDAAAIVKKLAAGRGPEASLFVLGGASPEPKTDASGLKPVHPETNLIDTLREVAGGSAGDFTDVLALSDGAETAARGIDAKALREAAGGLPVHAIGFGVDKIDNLLLEKLFADEFVVAGSAASIEGAVSAAGKGGRLSVEAFVDGKREAAKRFALKGGEGGAGFALRVEPEGVGLHAVSVRARMEKDEMIAVDNARTVYVRVVGGRRKALYADVPRWEFKYLKRYLESLEKIETNFLLITPKGNALRKPGRKILSSGALGKYRLVILGAIGGQLRPPEEAAIVEYARNGGRLIVLGGNNSLFSTRFSGIRGILPVSPAGGEVALGAFGVKLSGAGRAHAVTRLEDGARNESAWEGLPYLHTFNRSVAKEGAVVLAEHPWERCGGRQCPVIAAGAALGASGKGAVLALAAGGWWRWSLDPDHAAQYKVFWDNAIAWLVEAETRDGWALTLPKRNFAVGESVCVAARSGAGGRALEKVTAIVKNKTGGSEKKLILEKSGDENRYSACFIADEAGDFSVTLVDGKKELAPPEPFSAAVSAVEFLRPSRNAALLKALAEATGGKYYDASRADEAIRALRRSRSIKTIRTWNPLASPYVYLLIIALLSIEWAIRRREGFV